MVGIYKGSKEVTQVYKGNQLISYVYKGDKLVFQNNPYDIGETLVNSYAQAGNIELFGGVYLLKVVSAGGTGTHSAGYWFNAYASGGSGAVWEGTFLFKGSSKIISWTQAAFPGGSLILAADGVTWLTLTGGGNAVNGGGANNGGPGGVLTIAPDFSALVQTTQIATNGTKGDGKQVNFGTGSTGITATASTLGWGIGADSSNNGGNGGGIFIQRVA